MTNIDKDYEKKNKNVVSLDLYNLEILVSYIHIFPHLRQPGKVGKTVLFTVRLWETWGLCVAEYFI